MTDFEVLSTVKGENSSTRDPLRVERFAPFVPLRVEDGVRTQVTEFVVKMAASSPEVPSKTLRAGAGMALVILSNARRSLAVPRAQRVVATGLGQDNTVTKALAHPCSIVAMKTAGMKYDYATDTAAAAVWSMTTTVPRQPDNNLPVWALAPNNSIWTNSHVWRLALVLSGLDQFGFTTAQVRDWTGWSSDTAKDVLGKAEGTFISRTERGRYIFVPSWLADRNQPFDPTIPAWVETAHQDFQTLRHNRRAGAPTAGAVRRNGQPTERPAVDREVALVQLHANISALDRAKLEYLPA